MTRDPRVYLAHILECIQKIERFTAEGKPRFLEDDMVQDAVIRNRIIHEYAEVDTGIVWAMVQNEIPLIEEPEALLEEADHGG